jgi:hypothetical protein
VCSGHVLLLGPGDRWGEAGLNLVIYASRTVGKRSRNLPCRSLVRNTLQRKASPTCNSPKRGGKPSGAFFTFRHRDGGNFLEGPAR